MANKQLISIGAAVVAAAAGFGGGYMMSRSDSDDTKICKDEEKGFMETVKDKVVGSDCNCDKSKGLIETVKEKVVGDEDDSKVTPTSPGDSVPRGIGAQILPHPDLGKNFFFIGGS